MPSIQISVGGQIITLPGVYVNPSVAPNVPSGTIPTGPLIFIAAGYGGVPFQPTNYSDPNSLIAAMRGAPSSDFVQFFFDPNGGATNGTSLVTYINVAPNTQSSATILSSGTPASGVISMTSANYGLPSNLIQYSISSGSIAGKAMTILDGYSNVSYTGNNLGIPFQLAYTGTATTVKYSVLSTIAGQATSFVISSPNVGESVTIDLTQQTYDQISDVVTYLNGTGFYSAYVISNGQLPSSYLDVVSNVALPAPVASVDQYVNVTATLGDIVYFINSVASTIATASIPSNITSSPSFAPANIALAYFSGATNGVPSLSNYANGLNVALNSPGWVVHIDSNSSGVRALGAQHAAQASSVVNGAWRRYFTGSALNETQATAETNASTISQINVSYFWPGVQRTNTTTGLNQYYDGNHVAAAAAGIATGNPVPLPMTNKNVTGNGVEQIASVASMAQLQDNGVIVLNYPLNTRVPTFLADVTTWQIDSNPANVFNQQVACRYALNYYFKSQLQPYVGVIESNFTITQIRNAVVNMLNSVIYTGNSSIGILNSWDPSTLVLIYDGSTQTLTINVNVVFVGQNIWIVVDYSINPLNIQVSSTGVITNV